MFAKLLSFLPAFCMAICGSMAKNAFQNPVIFNDLADIDLFRVNETFYYSASSMHFSPGAPILQSQDLVNWKYLGHSVPSLEFQSPAYNLADGMRAYARGVWASTLRFRESNNLWYWFGCVDFNATYIYTSPGVTGPWEQKSVLDGTCFYDCGLLIDDDDTMYVTHGQSVLNVTQLTSDGLDWSKTQIIYNSTVGYIEGSRMYKRNGSYYIITDQPDNGQYVLKSDSGPWGPYDFGVILNNTSPPTSLGGADTPHQGALVDTPDGQWYYMAFVDVNGDSTGRVPVLSSLNWNDDGWPVLTLEENNAWPQSLPYPVDSGATTPNSDSSLLGKDTFADGKLGPQWEWNHNPDTERITVAPGEVRLHTATVTEVDDIYQARNTLTHRILGPASEATILLDYTNMADGDRAGLALLRDSSAGIGIRKDGDIPTLVMRRNMTMNSTDNWSTIDYGTDMASIKLPRTDHRANIFLRIAGDFRSSGTRMAQFSYSRDGRHFTVLGQNFTMINDWEFFQAYRFAIFNYATKALGGSVTLKEFTLQSAPN
ncbi:hypothetical protein N7474_010812 [Penicillium riverlandense]|uniref:uncharacterized protein n=1 Tax=Penicillium riverlandense TaxID=1903569 RepID=UPI0025493AB6|nr:uncharacterized protein N7474_010812 [Penicillium riverlandense]KAJ5804925.1 hypothetical protein N7474_010812 [Penicillium riverlandense]